MSPSVTLPSPIDFHQSLSILLDLTLELIPVRDKAFKNATEFRIVQTGTEGTCVELKALYEGEWWFIAKHEKQIPSRTTVNEQRTGDKTVLEETGEFIVNTARNMGIKGEIRAIPHDEDNHISCSFIEVAFFTNQLGGLISTIKEFWSDKKVTICVDMKALEFMVWESEKFDLIYT